MPTVKIGVYNKRTLKPVAGVVCAELDTNGNIVNSGTTGDDGIATVTTSAANKLVTTMLSRELQEATESVTIDDGAGGGGGGSPHALLDGGTAHTDTDTDTVSRGSLIVGSGASPKWTELDLSAPSTGLRNVLGVDNAETEPSWKTVLDTTDPSTIDASLGTPGSSLLFARRDHRHGIDLGVYHSYEWTYHSSTLASGIDFGLVPVQVPKAGDHGIIIPRSLRVSMGSPGAGGANGSLTLIQLLSSTTFAGSKTAIATVTIAAGSTEGTVATFTNASLADDLYLWVRAFSHLHTAPGLLRAQLDIIERLFTDPT